MGYPMSPVVQHFIRTRAESDERLTVCPSRGLSRLDCAATAPGRHARDISADSSSHRPPLTRNRAPPPLPRWRWTSSGTVPSPYGPPKPPWRWRRRRFVPSIAIVRAPCGKHGCEVRSGSQPIFLPFLRVNPDCGVPLPSTDGGRRSIRFDGRRGSIVLGSRPGSPEGGSDPFLPTGIGNPLFVPWDVSGPCYGRGTSDPGIEGLSDRLTNPITSLDHPSHPVRSTRRSRPRPSRGRLRTTTG
eukprot:scaffold644_cov357-Pavlova_lutheri.AAC.19